MLPSRIVLMSCASRVGRQRTHGLELELLADGRLTALELIDYTTKPAGGEFTPQESAERTRLEAAARPVVPPKPQPCKPEATETSIRLLLPGPAPVVFEFAKGSGVASELQALADFYRGVWNRLRKASSSPAGAGSK